MVTLMMDKKEKASASMAMMFVLIGAFVFVLITYSLLTSSMLMSHQHEIDDVLADSVLASCIGDKEYYFKTREEDTTSAGVIRFVDTTRCANEFLSCLYAEAGKGYERFYDNLKVEQLTFYEVEGTDVTITNFNQIDSSVMNVSTSHGTKGLTRTPTNAPVERTSVYARISFDVHAYFMFDITRNVTRDLYSTIKIDDASTHRGTDYFTD